MAEYPSSTPALATTLRRALDAAGPGVEVTVNGTRVLVALLQETFDAEGNARGVCRIEVEGVRGFGDVVTFANPPRVRVANALDGEHDEMVHVGRLLVEVLTDPRPPSPAARSAGA